MCYLLIDCVDQLVPEKVNVFITAKEFEAQCDRAEAWFGTK